MLYELQIIFIVNSPAYICRNETELGLLSFDDDAHRHDLVVVVGRRRRHRDSISTKSDDSVHSSSALHPENKLK